MDCTLCSNQGQKVTVWIDRNIDLVKDQKTGYDETFSLCDEHALCLVDSLFQKKTVLLTRIRRQKR